MGLSLELENYIQNSIENAVGLPVSENTLQSKLFAMEESRRVLQGQIFGLQDLVNDQNEKIERAKASHEWEHLTRVISCLQFEAAMNAQALRKSIEQNQQLNAEINDLTAQIERLNKECSLYDKDREALMEFGNDADERAREAEIRALEAEDAFRRLSEELNQSKREIEILTRLIIPLDDSLTKHALSLSKDGGHSSDISPNEDLLTSLVESTLGNGYRSRQELEEAVAKGLSFLEAHAGEEPHWRLRPSIRCILALAAEVSVLFEENKLLDEENKRLLRRCYRERNQQGSPSSHSSKSKRKASPRMNNAAERATDAEGPESPRWPLSPLESNGVHLSRNCNYK
ncbi:hypothetical protein EJ110_NYTH42305 [Nymphaea thermarum]|nr:hypothetical protein EJ110_NYTH42305 [Nymphaea thermarum]